VTKEVRLAVDFNIAFAAIAVVIFFSGYYLGWFARGKWDQKKLTFGEFGKKLKKKEK